MTDYFIEMGQGIIADANMRVFTSALYSCTFIAGHRDHRVGGAFHFPAGSMGLVRTALDEWFDALRPTEIKLVYADTVAGVPQMGTPREDAAELLRLFVGKGITPGQTRATAAYMSLVDRVFEAGSLATIAEPRDESQESDLSSQPARAYQGYTLFGKNRQRY